MAILTLSDTRNDIAISNAIWWWNFGGRGLKTGARHRSIVPSISMDFPCDFTLAKPWPIGDHSFETVILRPPINSHRAWRLLPSNQNASAKRISTNGRSGFPSKRLRPKELAGTGSIRRRQSQRWRPWAKGWLLLFSPPWKRYLSSLTTFGVDNRRSLQATKFRFKSRFNVAVSRWRNDSLNVYCQSKMRG